MPLIDVATSVAAVKKLREVYAMALAGQYTTTAQPSLTHQDDVLNRFQPMFAPEAIPYLTAEDFKSFLAIDNNRHWNSIHRHQTAMCSDMVTLRSALLVLADDNQPVGQRLEVATGKVNGMASATVTAILLIMFPKKYGVWNKTTEKGLATLDLLPSRNGMKLGEYYSEINDVLQQISRRMGTDLWTLDALWYYLVKGEQAK